MRNGDRLNTQLSKEMLIFSILVKVVGGTEGKEGHSFLEILQVVHPLLGDGSSDWESNQSTQNSTIRRASGESNQLVQLGKGDCFYKGLNPEY